MIDLAEVLKQGVPNSGTIREQIEYIDLVKVVEDDRNFYALSGIDDLAANIELLGLQQPIRVRNHPDKPGFVIIVSGHRRTAAIRKLALEGKKEFRQIPCIRERSEGSAALQELRLIYANSDTRKISPADLARQAERVEMLLYQLKEEGQEFPGRMRDHVATACKTSKSKLARLKVIREGLAESWKPLWEKNKLPEQTAYTLSRFPEDFQNRLFKVTNAELTGNGAERILAKYEEGWRWETTLTCPGGKACTHADAALRHDMDNYDMCGGNKCCLNCEQATRDWIPCQRMCSKAKEQRQQTKAVKDAEEEKRKQRFYTKNQNATRENAKRLMKAIDAAGLKDGDTIEWDRYGGAYPVKIIREFACGNFSNGGSFYDVKLKPDDLAFAAKLAKQLGCTTDYLLGMTDELTPAAADTQEREYSCKPEDRWNWSDPEESGLYWCIVGPMKGGGKLYWWNQEKRQWEAPGVKCELNVHPICWIRCPELPESISWNREE